MRKHHRMRWTSPLLFTCFAWLAGAQAASPEVVKETIVFLGEDGRSYIVYNTVRSSFASYNVFFRKDESLDKYFYIYPNEYRFDTSSPTENVLRFSQGDYAMLFAGVLDNVEVDENGVYTYASWDGKKRPDGHFGFWNTPTNFSQFAYVWVLPANFEVVDYQSNRRGEWVKRHNTLAYYGKNVNDLVFTIRYRPRARAIYDAFRESLSGRGAVELEQHGDGVRLTLEAQVLFPSGSSALSEEGKAVLSKIIDALEKRPSSRVIVEGHTDNVPPAGALAKVYPTNWELSAARAIAVVRYLVRSGVAEKRLEVRAFGAQRPRASNATAAGRAQNRRIEILVEEPSE